MSVSNNVGMPPHLYLLLNGGEIVNQDGLRDFVGIVNCPFTLEFEGDFYTLMSQGYYANKHYFSKVYHHSCGLSGIWLQNNLANDGYVRLISRVPSEIAGTSPDSSWLMYSRKWTKSEGKIVDTCIDKIIEDHPDAPGTSPFNHLKAVLSLTKPLDSQESFPQAGLLIEEKSKTEESKLEESKAETSDESKESKFTEAMYLITNWTFSMIKKRREMISATTKRMKRISKMA